MSDDVTPPRDPAAGLTSVEVAERVARGQTNRFTETTSRSIWVIFRDNVFTLFDAVIIALLVAVLTTRRYADALFGFVIVVNTAIGIAQELRAKRALDRISLLTAPRARVVRDGSVAEAPLTEIVLGDVIELMSGDQAPVDGETLVSDALEIDEALLTGESAPIRKAPGDRVLSGSIVVAGAGRIRATAVGDDAYARRIAAEARQFRRAPSDLVAGTNRILAIISWMLAPIAAVVVWGQLGAGGSPRDVVIATAGSLLGMIPQGLVLLTSVAFAVSVVRLARRNAVVDQLPSVEGLARVDVLCADKTGTLTESALQVSRVETLDGSLAADATAALGALARISPARSRNATAAAIAESFPVPAEAPSAVVAFSSRRQYSAVTLGGGTWVLGGPDALLAEGAPAREVVNAWAAEGMRALLVARAARLPDIGSGDDSPPDALEPALAVLFEERIRPDAADTLRYFREQGVGLRVISGDNPATVAAVARRVGLDMPGEPFDARGLPEAPEELAQVMESHNIFGRVRPEQKRAMVKALQSRGHTVAMTGDGVNDVLALKDADVGIAMGSGAAATRAVARLVLLDSRFAVLPDVMREGRRVIANIERVANLFVTKTVYSVWLSLAIALMRVEFPLLPRHLTLIGAATIGLPAAALAFGTLAPRYRPGFLPRVARFALIAGTAAAAVTFSLYVVSLGRGLSAASAKSPAVLTLALVGLWVLAIVARPWNAWRVALIASMAGLIALAFAAPEVARFLALPPMSAASAAVAIGAAIAAAVVIEAGLRLGGPLRHERARVILRSDARTGNARPAQ